ncbi:MAG TPA: hypothetical protein VGC18_10215, partial [Lacisediminihabitans sp.]|uniref:hypothetical protein n=1 Tax=Lacisediminihabitans sp. TaxID=2787631 RepID=UPI002ED9660F
MTARIPLPDPFASRPFSVSEARSAGFGRGRLTGADLAKPFWGVRTIAPPRPRTDSAESIAEMADVRIETGMLELCRAYAVRMSPDQFFSHVTAARLYRIPLPSRFRNDALLDVSVPFPARSVRAAGVRGHKQIIDPANLRLVHGMLASSPARVWCELAPLLSCEELVCVGDFLLWRRQPQASRAELEAAIAKYAGRAGGAKLLEALPELTDRSDSPPESTLRFRFVRAGLPPLAVNPMIYGPSGEFLGMPDLAFLRYRMLVDYEGDHHR